MNNMQLATTLGAQTGTGLLYTAYKQEGNSALWVNGSGVTRSQINWKRTEPKPSAIYAGNLRLDLRRTIFVLINGIEYPIPAWIGASIPAAALLADRTQVHNNLMLMGGSTIVKDAFETGVLPT